MRWTQWSLAVIFVAAACGAAAGQEIVGAPGVWMSPEMRYQLFSGPACTAPPYSYGPACTQCRRPCCENIWADYCMKKSRCGMCGRRNACGTTCPCTAGALTFSGAPSPWIEPAGTIVTEQPLPPGPEPTPATPSPSDIPVPAPEPTPAAPPVPAPDLPELQLPAPADAPPAEVPAAKTSWLRRLPPVEGKAF